MNTQQIRIDWWENHRKKYNIGLIISGIAAFFLYLVVGSFLIKDFEVTIFTTLFQGIGYLIMMGIANVFYCLGFLADKLFNKRNDDKFRKRLFNFGYWFSFGLPFLIPITIIVSYFMGYYVT